MSMKFLTVIALAGLVSAAAPVRAQTNATNTPAMHRLNTNPDADHTLSWREVRPAAENRFKQLDTDHDGTLSRQEAAKVGITASEFDQANTRGTHTLSQQEYLNLVQARFKAVNNNPNADQTLSGHELHSTAGENLTKLLSLQQQ